MKEKRSARAVKSPKPSLRERDVTRQVLDYLEWHGWRAIRNNVALATNLATGKHVRAGEPGMCDWLFLRYEDGASTPGRCLQIWAELKAPGKQPSVKQVEWQWKELQRGALVMTVDDYEVFKAWYEKTFGYLHGI